MKTAFYRIPAVLFALSAAATLPGCKSMSIDVPKVPGITPYRMVIQQGNFISQEMVAQLKPGMTKEQVRFVLGTPLVTDIFHADRWDYVFFREMPDGKKEQRNLSVVFEKDRLARVLGDLMPADGSTPRATGFEPLVKPDKPAAKPAAAATSSDQPEKKPEPAPVAKQEEQKPAEETKEQGFFGRLREKLGL
jgi:outer membrane protein assembly factor BamE